MNDVYDGLDLIGILLEDDGLILGKVLLALQARDALLLVLTDAVHLFPDLIFLAGESRLLSLLVKLREIFVHAPVKRVIGQDFIRVKLVKHHRTEIFEKLILELLI
jgi:hypothetical protein